MTSAIEQEPKNIRHSKNHVRKKNLQNHYFVSKERAARGAAPATSCASFHIKEIRQVEL